METTNVYQEVQDISEDSILISFYCEGNVARPSPALSKIISETNKSLRVKYGNLIYDSVPSYNTLLIYYDFIRIDYQHFVADILQTTKHAIRHATQENDTQHHIRIPVYYGKEVGLDLDNLAEQKQISIEKIIQLHTQKFYTVYAIGFTPGFAYMGFVDPVIATPRKSTPRVSVPKGSVGIADQQTGIYPGTSPGGWNIVGRTPINLEGRNQTNEHWCSTLSVGDTIQFSPIDKEKFLKLGGELN